MRSGSFVVCGVISELLVVKLVVQEGRLPHTRMGQ